jgi:hypothetical protein
MPKIKPLIEVDVGENTKKIFSANWKLAIQLILFQFGITLLFAPIIFYYLASISFQTPIQENKIIVSNCSVENLVNSTINSTLEKIMMMASNVSNSHEFVQGLYDCSQYSIDLKKNLTAENISSFCVYGYYKDYHLLALHTWVQTSLNGEIINIEATSGDIISNETFFEHYKIIGKGVCF